MDQIEPQELLSREGEQPPQQHWTVPHLQSTVCSPLTLQSDSHTRSSWLPRAFGRIHKRRREGRILCTRKLNSVLR